MQGRNRRERVEMVGIMSYGAYVPYNRLERARLAEAYGRPAREGTKAVAGHDEDSITLAAAAALDACGGLDTKTLDGIFLASTTLPYREKQCATVLAAALDLRQDVRTADVTGSLRCGSTALLSALDAVRCGDGPLLVAAADCRTAFADGENEGLFGDGAAAFIIGNQDLVATVDAAFCVSRDFHDQWRAEGDPFVKGWEERYAITQQYGVVLRESIAGILAETGLEPGDFHRVVLYAHTPRYRAELARDLGFAPDQLQDDLSGEIGNAGAASGPLMLCAALERAKPGDRILYLGYGEGGEALVLTATDAITSHPNRLTRTLARKSTRMNYEKYLRWRRLITPEPQRRPPRMRVSLPQYYRRYRQNFALVGTRCTACGTPQFPGARVCVRCGALDRNEPYGFRGRKATIATYTVDRVSASEDPPNLFAVVDFDGGGRMFCCLVDCEPEEIAIGRVVGMVFRRLHVTDGIHTYFWKAVLRDREEA